MRKCLYCGKEFKQNKIGRKRIYCCDKCKDKAKHEKNKSQKTCPGCNKWFKTINKKQIYCSKSCANSHRQYNKKCLNCEKKYISNQSNGKFCSYECRYEWQNKTKSNKIHKLICQQCGKEFMSQATQQKYCSYECSIKAHTKPENRFKCKYCGKEFNGQKNSQNKFCSRGCYLKQIGADSWDCKDYGRITDISHIRRAKYYGVEYEKINLIDIFERDNWTCKICDKKIDDSLPYPNPMSASLDHIIPLSKGGSHTLNNVQSSHLSCNIKKKNKFIEKKNGQLSII